jgi:UDP-N-acetylmuramoyl-tripeptide--D-alanyl-D-alanine ligase
MPTLHDLHETIGGVLGRVDDPPGDTKATPLGNVVTDSRNVEAGDVFWALVGKHHDGAEFASEAFARGASGIVARTPVDTPPNAWGLTVRSPGKALWQWASWNRRRFSGTLIAVTGSVGKTTTRQMIHTVLAGRLSGTASPRNYNNHVGVPLSLLRIDPADDYAVIELGANAKGEIAALAKLTSPRIGVITNIGDAHLAGFGSRHGIAQAKAELLAALPPDGHAIVGDDVWLRRLARDCPAPMTCVGRGADCDLAATGIRAEGGNLSFALDGCQFDVPVWGRHHLTSVLAAVAVGRLMGIEVKESAAALEDFDSVPMRCEVTEIRGATIINDAYNSSPMAMRAALEVLREFDAPGRRIIVCGDMGELGDEAAELHYALGNEIVTLCGADLLIACGHFARDVVAGARDAGMPKVRSIACRTPEETLPYLGQAILPGDVALVKGSRVLAMERVVEALRSYPRRRGA